MTSVPRSNHPSRSLQTRPSRLRLKPATPMTGFVDGGWWPRSRELAMELPALAIALAERLGPLRRVAFSMASWDDTPRRVQVGDCLVRLEGFRTQDENTVYVMGADQTRISLLVVPATASDTAGARALESAAYPDSTDRPATILAASGALPPRPDATGSKPENHRENDGGSVVSHR